MSERERTLHVSAKHFSNFQLFTKMVSLTLKTFSTSKALTFCSAFVNFFHPLLFPSTVLTPLLLSLFLSVPFNLFFALNSSVKSVWNSVFLRPILSENRDLLFKPVGKIDFSQKSKWLLQFQLYYLKECDKIMLLITLLFVHSSPILVMSALCCTLPRRAHLPSNFLERFQSALCQWVA